MANQAIEWPRKARELHNHHFDSTIWNNFQFRDDDIFIATYAKAGTTWLQQIISQLIFNGAEGLEVAEMSPWLDLRVPPKEVKLPEVEAQTHRRFIKTHLPVDALVFSPKGKYIYIGRDGRDVVWSMYNHHSTANEKWYDALNNTPGRIGPPIEKPSADVRQYYHDWLDRDGHPWWPFWENVRSWWAIRELPNVLMLHFACAGKARSRGTRCRDVIFETLFETLWVSNPIRPRSAASRNRVMRGPGVTQGAKRSQGARRPRN